MHYLYCYSYNKDDLIVFRTHWCPFITLFRLTKNTGAADPPVEDHSWSTCKNSHQSDSKVKCAVVFVLPPGQAEVRVGSLAAVALPARRGGVERREYGARGGGGAPSRLRGREAVSTAQTLMEKGSLHSRCMFYTQAEDAGRVTGTTLSYWKVVSICSFWPCWDWQQRCMQLKWH